MEHDVSQYVDGLGEVFLGDDCVIDGVFLVGESVEFASQSLDGVDDLDGIATGRAFETHVFAEMSQSFLTWQLVARACSNVITTIDHLRVGGQMDDAETIFEGICVIFCHFVCKVKK